jgi:hypothetical protein
MLMENINYCFNTTITIMVIIIIIKIINIIIILIFIKIAQTSIKIGTYRLIFHEDYYMSRGDVKQH